MNILHGVVLVLLCLIVLLNIKMPIAVQKLGTVPVTIILLFVVLYLFTQSPILGIVGVIAVYQLMMTPKYSLQLPTEPKLNQDNQFEETLEETIVKKMVPMINVQSPAYYKNSVDDDHSAGTI